MTIIALGDTHGRPNWKTIIEKEEFDKIVFVGDYFDSKEFILEKQQKKNFEDIIAFKKTYPEKVTLLFGNHDFHYLPYIDEKYSSYQASAALEIGKMLEDALSENLIQMCFRSGGFLFTHAGVTKTWAEANEIDLDNVEESINSLFIRNPSAFKFTIGINRSLIGDDISQTPIWVRPISLISDKIEGYTQVVGHTNLEQVSFSYGPIFIDTLGTSGQYLKIVDQVPVACGNGSDL
jgi:predicted MPP superfamily phosphohydrolase